jgi:uncharacterized membrane protein
MQQPPGNQPPPYGSQPPSNQSPQYGDQPPQYGSQSPYGSPPPAYGGQPPQYGNQPPQYGGQSPYGGGPPLGEVQPQEENDKLIAAGAYVFWLLIGIVILVTDLKNKPFLRFHAYQSITFGIVMFVAWSIAGVLSFVLIGLCIMPVLFLIPFYFAYLAYSKGVFRIPLVTNLTYSIFKETPPIP